MQCKYDDKDCDCIDPGTMECLFHEFYVGDCECFGEEIISGTISDYEREKKKVKNEKRNGGYEKHG